MWRLHPQQGVQCRYDPHDRCQERTEERRAGTGINRQLENSHAEGRDDGAAADPVGPADDTDNERNKEHRWYAKTEPFSPEFILDFLQIRDNGPDHRFRRDSCHGLCIMLFCVALCPLCEIFYPARFAVPCLHQFSRPSNREVAPDMEKYDADEHLENPVIRQVKDAKIIADEDSRQRADDDNPCKGPCHAAFLEIAVHAARNGSDMVEKIGGIHCWRGKK